MSTAPGIGSNLGNRAAVCPPAGNPGREEMEKQPRPGDGGDLPQVPGHGCTGQLPAVVSGLRGSWQLNTASQTHSSVLNGIVFV
jgi:hypothetical protein